MVEIIPAILTNSRQDYLTKLKAVEPFTEWVQVDIVDGLFAPSKTIGPEVVKALPTNKKLEIQLMVKNIDEWVEPFIDQKVERIIVPIETSHNPISLINKLKQKKIQVGFSLNPQTKVESVRELVDKVDMILLLAVNPGFQGQHFFHGVLKKIKDIKAMRNDVYIEIDGGVQPGIARKCVEAGADALAVGSFVLKNDQIAGATYQERIKNSIQAVRDDVSGVA